MRKVKLCISISIIGAEIEVSEDISEDELWELAKEHAYDNIDYWYEMPDESDQYEK